MIAVNRDSRLGFPGSPAAITWGMYTSWNGLVLRSRPGLEHVKYHFHKLTLKSGWSRSADWTLCETLLTHSTELTCTVWPSEGKGDPVACCCKSWLKVRRHPRANLCHPLWDTVVHSVQCGSCGSTQCGKNFHDLAEWVDPPIRQNHPLLTSIQMLLKLKPFPKAGHPWYSHKLRLKSDSHCTDVQWEAKANVKLMCSHFMVWSASRDLSTHAGRDPSAPAVRLCRWQLSRKIN